MKHADPLHYVSVCSLSFPCVLTTVRVCWQVSVALDPGQFQVILLSIVPSDPH